MTFYTGQKVVCAREHKDTWGDRWYAWRHPPPGDDIEVGKTYTVSAVHAHEDGKYSIELWEVYSPADEWWCAGFKAELFRPLTSRPTSIEIFRKELKPKVAILQAAQKR